MHRVNVNIFKTKSNWDVKITTTSIYSCNASETGIIIYYQYEYELNTKPHHLHYIHKYSRHNAEQNSSG